MASRDAEVPPLPRRIVVYGATGSGKTTLSRRLSDVLGIGVIELDALFHLPGWQETPPDEFRRKVAAAIERYPDGWVADGNYSAVRNELLLQADTVVWIRVPWRVSFWRLFWRTVTRAWRREELWNTNRESWRLSFMSRDSILWWSIHHHQAHKRGVRAAIAQAPSAARIYELQSSREVRRFIDTLESRCRAREAAPHVQA